MLVDKFWSLYLSLLSTLFNYVILVMLYLSVY
jgi:hypothetical protein